MKTIHHPAYIQVITALRDARHAAGLTQAQAAARIGMSRVWIGKIECCELRLDVLHFAALCRAYGLRPARLMRGLGEELSDEDGSLLTYHTAVRIRSQVADCGFPWYT